MKLRNLVYCLGITLCLCSCDNPQSSQHTKTESFDYEIEFSKLTNQSEKESELEFYKVQNYVSEARKKAIKKVSFTFVDSFGCTRQNEAESIDHELLNDKCEYMYKEDSDYNGFAPNSIFDHMRETDYLYEKKNDKTYSVQSIQKNPMDESIVSYETSNNEIISVQGDFNPVVSEGHAADLCIHSVGLADRLFLSKRVRYYLNVFSNETSFSTIKDNSNNLYFKVKKNEAYIRLCSNMLFRGYDDETGTAEIVPGGAGYNVDRDGPLSSDQRIGTITQEFKFSNYLLTYYNITYELNGKRDLKWQFMRVK